MKQLTAVLISFITGGIMLLCSTKYQSVYSEDWSDLDLLPEDTGGEHLAVPGKEYPKAKNGFYIYFLKKGTDYGHD